jgi:hypothetical protein
MREAVALARMAEPLINIILEPELANTPGMYIVLSQGCMFPHELIHQMAGASEYYAEKCAAESSPGLPPACGCPAGRLFPRTNSYAHAHATYTGAEARSNGPHMYRHTRYICPCEESKRMDEGAHEPAICWPHASRGRLQGGWGR